uniref:receptor protein-tyrosine kinase n=1 Tax=Globodera rostochiensis TaxID=31243 RepID=A0A914HYJ7_GLORO
MISFHFHSQHFANTSSFPFPFLPIPFGTFLLLLVLVNIATPSRSASRDIGEHFARYGPPRFKQNARAHQFAYLGDTIRFKCNAIGRPQPRVHWYREGRYLNYSYMLRHPRLKERGMSLEVKRIEVGDGGNWTCRVWNNEGSTNRNFTLHIVDFCDYFLNVHIHPRRVPEKCLCQWAVQQRESLQAHDPLYLRALPQLRADLDLSEFIANNGSRCAHYAKVEEIARLRTQPREDAPKGWADEKSHQTDSTATSTSSTANLISTSTKSAVKWTLRKLSAKIRLANKIMGEMKQKDVHDGDEEDEDDDEEERHRDEWRQKADRITTTPATTTTNRTPWTTRTTRAPPSWAATKRWSLPQRVPPYFRQLDEQTLTHIVIPAGRTLKLSCKAGGQPEPQVVWRKDNEEILRDTESKTGSLFQLKKWTLELEDATENDSGEYVCEVFNSAGLIVRRFRVEVQDRIRSRPILVPNVLLNRTVDVNGTVDFSCQVISDLVPHIVWIKLIKNDGTFIRWDTKRKQYTFNFLDMSTHKRARIFHDKQMNRYTLEIVNVTMDDQGIYSCVAGNTLGMSMANATLTVNEFRPLTLPTDVSHSWPLSYTVLVILSFLLLCAFVSLGMLYLFFSKKFSAKNRVQTLDSMSVRKKVVITKKPQREGDFWSDLASSYSITVEPVPVRGRGGRTKGGSTGDLVPLMEDGQHGAQPTSGPAGETEDTSPLSEYEVPTDTAWEVERERLQMVDILGEGAFGEVWRGQLSPKSSEEAPTEPIPVAVKRLKTAAQERELIILVSEMQILKSIGHHPNILRLVGCCTGLGPLLVVLELCGHGNLKDFLRKHRPMELERGQSLDGYVEEGESTTGPEGTEKESDRSESKRSHVGKLYQNMDSPGTSVPMASTSAASTAQMPNRQLTLRDLVRFAAEIAKGMDFLASKKIIHRDLAARNVLVADNVIMKISDFGLSRNVFYNDYYRKRGAGRLPIKWMAPEALEANVYTVHSDVWSYGILLWEIMTLGGTPYPSIAMPQLYNLLKEGYRMEAPHNCPEEIYEVMVSCWQDRPEARPAFRTIADYFDWMLKESENYVTRTSDGETTDEGPYAVITERQNGKGRGGGGAKGPEGRDGGTEEAKGRAGQCFQDGTEASGGGTQQRMLSKRPVSAPGMMSFEKFSREIGIGSGEALPRALHSDHPHQQHKSAVATSPQAKSLPPRPERRFLFDQEKPLIELGSESSGAEGRAEEMDRGRSRAETKAGNVYKNLQTPCRSNEYANTPSPCPSAALTGIHQRSGPSSSAEAIPPSGCHAISQPPKQRSKKSVTSEHGLRVQVSGGWPRRQDGSSKGSSLGVRLGDWRSRSVDSSSSGHGGSSAMSSAEGLLGGGAATETEGPEEGEDQQQLQLEPEGVADNYVSIASIGHLSLRQ